MMSSSQVLRFLKTRWKVALVLAWLLFCFSLTIWWIIFGLRQIDQLATYNHLVGSQILKQQNMLVSEGIILLLSLVGGGVALLSYTYLENQKRKEIESFFAAFTHDLKTSLASLRIQTDTLQDEISASLAPGSIPQILFSRLTKDTVRLELQLENALLISSDANHGFFLENLDLQDIITNVGLNWPDLKIRIEGQGFITSDRRALQIIFKNLIHNSIVHGKSTEVSIRIQKSDEGMHLLFQDNGSGFSGDIKKLGRLFSRHSETSGSGVGLFIVAALSRRLGGQVEFPRSTDNSKGFRIGLLLKEASP